MSLDDKLYADLTKPKLIYEKIIALLDIKETCYRQWGDLALNTVITLTYPISVPLIAIGAMTSPLPLAGLAAVFVALAPINLLTYNIPDMINPKSEAMMVGNRKCLQRKPTGKNIALEFDGPSRQTIFLTYTSEGKPSLFESVHLILPDGVSLFENGSLFRGNYYNKKEYENSKWYIDVPDELREKVYEFL